MEYRSLDDIFAINEKLHQKLQLAVGSLTGEQAAALPEGEKWSVSQIVEHISLVEDGIYRICSKLLRKAEAAGQMNSGQVDLTNFMKKAEVSMDAKLEAPEYVHPVNGRTIAESLELLDANMRRMSELKLQFEKYDGNAFKFPHPYFGDLSAVEWLTLSGGHKIRHVRQIEKLIQKAATGI